jgi:hypothetical protein
MKLLLLLVSAMALSFSIATHADIYEQGLVAAFNDHSSTIAAFTQFQLNKKTQSALNAMVAASNEALAEHGFVEDAQTAQREWDQDFSASLTAMQLYNIGDHAPMSAWLSNFYDKTRDRLGDPVMKLLHLDDLYTINYTMPVVFHPKGDTKGQDHWNQLEYQRHFIPFASIITYWGSFAACRAVAFRVTPIKRWCSSISMILRGAMKGMIAPKLSNYIYKKFSDKVGSGGSSDLNLADLDEYYQQEILKIQK